MVGTKVKDRSAERLKIFSEEVTFEQRLKGEQGASHVDICREQVGWGYSHSKAPREGPWFAEGAARRPVCLEVTEGGEERWELRPGAL